MSTRKSYTAEKKLKIVDYAEIHGNREAARVYNTDERNVRDWRKNKTVLQTMKPSKRALRLRREFWPDLEIELETWIIDQRKESRRVSTINIQMRAKQIANEKCILNFKASHCWINRFMKRRNLSVRAVTSLGQKLPQDWKEKMAAFKLFVEQNIQGIELQQIGNMDEVPMSFDMPSNFTIDKKGSENIKISTTGSEKCNFTVVLCVTADGGKLPPFVIFKRKTIPKLNFPKGIVVSVNPKGWMTAEMFSLWFQKVWKNRKGSFFNPKSLLILDSARSHLTGEVQQQTKSQSRIAVIPGGLTKLLQPLDISVNKSFKNIIRNLWEDWMINGYKTFTKGGNMKKASYNEVCHWIVKSWDMITPQCIKNGFRKSTVEFYGQLKEHDIESVEYEDEDEIEHNVNQNEAPDELIEILKGVDLESDESFDGFD